MKTFPDWNGQRYYPISQFYKNKFGEKVHKISVSVVQTCPNRKRTGGEGCIFCDEWGSAGNRLEKDLPLRDQILIGRKKLANRFKVKKFLVYFQPFTNTFTSLDRLKKNIELALKEDQISGVVLGTRPDCLPMEIFPLLKKFQVQSFISVELGAQSFLDQRLDFLNRGHTSEQVIMAIKRLHNQSGVNVGVHLIFGLPGETDEEIIATAKIINTLPVDNVKIHNLHVLANTTLEGLYRKNQFKPLELKEYAHRVILFLEHLSPGIAVQRLAAYVGNKNQLIAPSWTKERLQPSQYIQNQLKELNTFQGKQYR